MKKTKNVIVLIVALIMCAGVLAACNNKNENSTYTLTVNGGTGSGAFDEGTQVTATATIPSGKEFVAWFEGDTQVSTVNPYTFTLERSIVLTAAFEYGNDFSGTKFTEWPTEQINHFLGTAVPAFTGASGFNILFFFPESIKITAYDAESGTAGFESELESAGFSFVNNTYRKTTTDRVITVSGLTAAGNIEIIINCSIIPVVPYTLPENVKVVYTDAFFYTYTAVKIGNDYYGEKIDNISNEVTARYLLKYDAETQGWLLNYNQGSWNVIDYPSAATLNAVIKGVEFFGGILSRINGYDFRNATKTQTTGIIAGRAYTIYSTDSEVNMWVDDEYGVILKFVGAGVGAQRNYMVTLWDETVTDFDSAGVIIGLPM